MSAINTNTHKSNSAQIRELAFHNERKIKKFFELGTGLPQVSYKNSVYFDNDNNNSPGMTLISQARRQNRLKLVVMLNMPTMQRSRGCQNPPSREAGLSATHA